MIIRREITPHLKKLAQQFPVIAVMGPRQSGKTTLVRETFPEYTYITLEDLDIKMLAKQDPRLFLATYSNKVGVIFDEIQEVPELLSYMQAIVDQQHRPGYFVVTGSQNFLMYEKITQTLAGRIALLTLLPLTVYELQHAKLLPESLETLMLKGLYPRLYSQNIDISLWVSNYITTYVEKDVRQVLNVSDILGFQRFLKLCAARIGNLINYADLARDADISPNTAKAWLSVLETSYIIRLLAPYYRNFNKRIIKSPKLYFYDSGLACSLLGIRNEQELFMHPLRGALFESFIISELFKNRYNQGEIPHLYFWRDIQGHEIDCIIEKSLDNTVAVEIKARMTMSDDFFKELKTWQGISGQSTQQSYVMYAGKQNHETRNGSLIGWPHIHEILKKIYE